MHQPLPRLYYVMILIIPVCEEMHFTVSASIKHCHISHVIRIDRSVYYGRCAQQATYLAKHQPCHMCQSYKLIFMSITVGVHSMTRIWRRTNRATCIASYELVFPPTVGARHAMYLADEAVIVTNPEVSSCRDSDKMVGFISSKSRRAETGEAPVRQTLLVTRYGMWSTVEQIRRWVSILSGLHTVLIISRMETGLMRSKRSREPILAASRKKKK